MIFSRTSMLRCPSSTLTSPMRDKLLVGIDAQGIMLGGVEFDDGAASHAQEMMDRHDRRAELDGEFNFDLVEDVGIWAMKTRLAPCGSNW